MQKSLNIIWKKYYLIECKLSKEVICEYKGAALSKRTTDFGDWAFR